MITKPGCVCVLLLTLSRPCGAGEEDHGGSEPAHAGHPCLGAGHLRRPVEGHGAADPRVPGQRLLPPTGPQVRSGEDCWTDTHTPTLHFISLFALHQETIPQELLKLGGEEFMFLMMSC